MADHLLLEEVALLRGLRPRFVAAAGPDWEVELNVYEYGHSDTVLDGDEELAQEAFAHFLDMAADPL